MGERNPRDPADREDRGTAIEYDNWPVEGTKGEDTEWLDVSGVTGDVSDAPALYQPADGIVYGTEADEENRRLISDREMEWEVETDDAVGEVIEEIGETVGWVSLSEYARDHLNDESEPVDERE